MTSRRRWRCRTRSPYSMPAVSCSVGRRRKSIASPGASSWPTLSVRRIFLPAPYRKRAPPMPLRWWRPNMASSSAALRLRWKPAKRSWSALVRKTSAFMTSLPAMGSTCLPARSCIAYSWARCSTTLSTPATAKFGCAPSPNSIFPWANRCTSALPRRNAWDCRRKGAAWRGSWSMSEAKIIGLRSVELAVRDLNAAVAFYNAVWGLREVSAGADTVYLRGPGSEHHAVTLRQRPQSGLLGVHFAATDRNAVDALHAKLKGYGIPVVDKPIELPRAAGGGYGF